MYTIVYTSDNNYCGHLATALTSLFHHNNFLDLEIYILSCAISSHNKSRITHICSHHSSTVSFIEVSHMLSDMFTSRHLSLTCYARFLIPDLINRDVCVYLDVDTLVNGTIKGLYSLSDFAHPVAAVRCPYVDITPSFKSTIGMSETSPYFNSGVMLLDLNKWRHLNASEHLLSISKSNTFNFHDQDALNLFFEKQWYILPETYNFIDPQRRQSSNPLIYHLVGSPKPDSIYYSLDRWKRLYWSYRSKTPYWFHLGIPFSFITFLPVSLVKYFRYIRIRSRLRSFFARFL